MPLIGRVFPLNYFIKNFKYLSDVQALVAIGLISKNFYLLHAFSSPGKGWDKVFHFYQCMCRRGYAGLL
jgi:hypothetical protein